MSERPPLHLIITAAGLLVGCNEPKADPSVTPPETGPGLFTEGCPVAGEATARVIQDPDSRMEGSLAVAGVGDFQLMNDQVAFVITQPGSDSTYWYYGGALADAARIEGCTQVTDDLLEDVGLNVISLDLANFGQSRLRGFEGLAAEVLSDGSEGKAAVVRVTGVDATHWLVEHELQKAAVADGDRIFGLDLGLEMTVDYILPPDSSVLEIEVTLTGSDGSPATVAGASLIRFGPTLETRVFPTRSISAFGLSMDAAIPWLLASHGEGALAFAVGGINLATMNIGGIDIALDLDQTFTDPVRLDGPTSSGTYRHYLAVGASDGNSATRALHAVHPDPLGLGEYDLVPIAGNVLDALDGGAVDDAVVEIQAQVEPDGSWGALDAVRTAGDGSFEADIAVLDPTWSYRVVATAPGRPTADPVSFDPSASGVVAVTIPPAGSLVHDLNSAAGAPIPVRVDLTRDDGTAWRLHLLGAGEVPLEPGDYDWVATRGWEWTRQTGSVTVPEGGSAPLDVTLEHVLDTTGFLSVDSHIHSHPSPDSRVQMTRQLLVAASHGLDVAMSTDHEAIVGFDAALIESGLEADIGIVSGLEMTASSIEHMTTFPMVPDGSPQGGIVEWYGLGFDEMIQASYDRGASVVLLNHPGYLGRIGWDMVTGEPAITDPALFGLGDDQSLFSFGFDGLEVMGGGNPFGFAGGFEKWQAMLNHGHPMTAVGSSDDHGGSHTGYARTYFVSSTDDPSAWVEQDLVDAFLSGAAVMSAGAFLRVEANGAGLGELADTTGDFVDVAIRVDALPEMSVSHVMVFANCDEVARIDIDQPDDFIKLDTEVRVPLERDAHLAVAVFRGAQTPEGLFHVHEFGPLAMSNAIYVDIDGNGEFDAPGGKTCSYEL